MVTLDVEQMYKNIPIKDGVESVGEHINRDRHHNKRPTNKAVCDLIKLVLEL